MDALSSRMRGGSRPSRNGRKAWAGRSVEALEERELLSSGMGAGPLGGFGIGTGGKSGRAAEMSTFRAGRRGGFFGGGSLGLGGGMNNPSFVADSAST